MTQVITTLDGEDHEDIPLWVHIPEGYFPLPLNDVESSLARADAVLGDLAGAEQQPQIHALTEVLTVFLGDLASLGTLYCGIGRHTSPVDGSIVTSSLVVSFLPFEGTRNPRLVLKDLVGAEAEAGERGQADLVDIDDRPILFFERTRRLPPPPQDDEAGDYPTAPVFQLEAFVPAADGSKLANIELSTPFEAHGPEFRAMIVQMAASVSFEPPVPAGETGTKIGEVLG
jgi:hypothetical protein